MVRGELMKSAQLGFIPNMVINFGSVPKVGNNNAEPLYLTKYQNIVRTFSTLQTLIGLPYFGICTTWVRTCT